MVKRDYIVWTAESPLIFFWQLSLSPVVCLPSTNMLISWHLHLVECYLSLSLWCICWSLTVRQTHHLKYFLTFQGIELFGWWVPLMTWRLSEEGSCLLQICVLILGWKLSLQEWVWCGERGHEYCAPALEMISILSRSVTVIFHSIYLKGEDVSSALQIRTWQLFILEKNSEVKLLIEENALKKNFQDIPFLDLCLWF